MTLMHRITSRTKPRASIASLYLRSLLHSYACQGYAPDEARRRALTDFNAPLPF